MKHSQLPFLKFFLLSILSFTVAVLYAQQREIDAVYLNSGEVYRGNILEQNNPEVLRLKTLCSNIRIFGMEEIDRIERENISYAGTGDNLSIRGYFNRSDLGILMGSGNENNSIFTFQMVNGYKIGYRYFPGVGLGVEFFEQAVIPVFADFSYVLGKGRVMPFFRGSLGYSFPLEDPPEQWGSRTVNHGGILYGLGCGTSVRTGNNSFLVISLIYRYQSLKSDYEEDWSQEVLKLEQRFNRLAISVGFMFD
jgi:hypothetical protein